jgi:isocitrate dehydrogenase (NAD+)
MAYDVTLMPGDGIGPEVVEAARRVLEATGIDFNWDYQDLGMVAQEKHGTTLPDATIQSVQRTKVGLKGPTTTPVGTGFRSVNVGLRQALNLYANLRPAKTYQGVRSTFDNVDLIIVRENLEDLYAGVEFDTGTP